MNDEQIELMKRMIRTDLEKSDLSFTEKALEECIFGMNPLYSTITGGDTYKTSH